MLPDNQITTVDAGQGKTLSIAGGTYRILISGAQTGGSYAVIEMLVPPGGGPVPHAHKDIQELFFVVEGQVEFKMEGGRFTAAQGAFVNIPLGGAVHCFKNNTNATARLLCTVVPAGLEAFFEEAAMLVNTGAVTAPQSPGPEDRAKLQQLAEKHGQKLYPPNFLD